MKQQHYVLGTRIFKVLLALFCLASIKLVLILCLGLTGIDLNGRDFVGQQGESHSPQTMVDKTGVSLNKGTGLAQAATALAQSVKSGSGQTSAGGGTGNLSEMGSLAKQWQALKQKQQELRRKEKDLQELERRLDQKLAREIALKKKLEDILKEVEVLKDKKIKHLVDVYSNMEPKQAAKVLESLDEKIAVKILAGMRGRTAGEILSFVQPEKAAKLSEALTVFQTPFGQ